MSRVFTVKSPFVTQLLIDRNKSGPSQQDVHKKSRCKRSNSNAKAAEFFAQKRKESIPLCCFAKNSATFALKFPIAHVIPRPRGFRLPLAVLRLVHGPRKILNSKFRFLQQFFDVSQKAFGVRAIDNSMIETESEISQPADRDIVFAIRC